MVEITPAVADKVDNVKITNSYEKTLFWLFTATIASSFITFVLSYTPQNIPFVSFYLVNIFYFLNIILFVFMLVFSMIEIRKGNKALGLVVLIYSMYSLLTVIIGYIEPHKEIVTGNVIANVLN
jgi:FtsH-binding integral membrane protein